MVNRLTLEFSQKFCDDGKIECKINESLETDLVRQAEPLSNKVNLEV
ncbi:MAG: hypothetical protein KAS87_03485 [Candidatus Omnitrophica bacterium]|nr:hypothetical protein [Candidatus Omnitrophota bacterium]